MEAALYTALVAHQDLGSVTSLPDPINSAILKMPRPQRSKAERQNEWRQLPLATRQDLLAWLKEKHQATDTSSDSHPRKQQVPFVDSTNAESVQAESSSRYTISDLNDDDLSAQVHVMSPPARPAMEQLKSCTPPIVPNWAALPFNSIAWYERYF